MLETGNISKSAKIANITETTDFKYLKSGLKEEIYIGSATRLGDRVKPGRHEIPGWNKFRYEIIHPKYYKELKTIEYHSIMNFSRFFNNNGNFKLQNYFAFFDNKRQVSTKYLK